MTTKTINPEYEALGIHPDTMTCVAIMKKSEAKEYVWSLASVGVHAIASRDVSNTDGRGLWHVAVPGGLGYNPRAYFVSITGEGKAGCTNDERKGQHPIAREENDGK